MSVPDWKDYHRLWWCWSCEFWCVKEVLSSLGTGFRVLPDTLDVPLHCNLSLCQPASHHHSLPAQTSTIIPYELDHTQLLTSLLLNVRRLVEFLNHISIDNWYQPKCLSIALIAKIYPAKVRPREGDKDDDNNATTIFSYLIVLGNWCQQWSRLPIAKSRWFKLSKALSRSEFHIRSTLQQAILDKLELSCGILTTIRWHEQIE